jgi:hypothetical protein
MHIFRLIGEAMFEGQNVYFTGIPHPYLPLQLYWFAIAHWLTEGVGLTIVFWFKVPSILAEVAMTGLVYSAIRRMRTEKDALLSSWIYALNPVTTLVAAYQGQFDAIPLVLMVAAWYLFDLCAGKRWSMKLSSFAMGLGILSKSWPVMLLPIILLRLPHWRSRLKYTAIVVATPMIGTLFYELLFPGSLLSILQHLTEAGAPPGWWGHLAILNVIAGLAGYDHGLFQLSVRTSTFATPLCGALAILLTRRRPALYSLMLTILTLFAVFPNFGVQYLSWLVPVGLILGTWNELGWYIAGAMTHMVTIYWGMHFSDGLFLLMPATSASVIIQISSLAAWGVILLWDAQEFLHLRLLPGVFHPNLAGATAD